MIKKICNLCESERTAYIKKKIFYINGAIDEVEEVKCLDCGNIVWGRIVNKKKGEMVKKKVRGE